MSLDTYQRNLRHCAEPSSPVGRREASRISLADYEALFLAERLEDYMAYHSHSAEDGAIATAYVEYLNHRVRELESTMLYVYAHTAKAKYVLQRALIVDDVGCGEMKSELLERIEEEL